MIDLIFCAAGNRRYVDLAVEHGFLPGAQLPGTWYQSLHFVDQDPNKPPTRRAYMRALKKARPVVATVLDIVSLKTLDIALSWAHEAAWWCDSVVLIPKIDCIGDLPRHVGKANTILGYSVETSHGSTSVPLYRFEGWNVHLLGGAPHTQMSLVALYPQIEFVSADCNAIMKMAHKGMFWANKSADYGRNRRWPTLREADGQRWPGHGPLEALRRSFEATSAAWRGLPVPLYGPQKAMGI
jgi:hypothetical protein